MALVLQSSSIRRKVFQVAQVRRTRVVLAVDEIGGIGNSNVPRKGGTDLATVAAVEGRGLEGCSGYSDTGMAETSGAPCVG